MQINCFLEDSNGQDNVFPSQVYYQEDSVPLFNNEEPGQQIDTISTQQQTSKREHTAPKILLSVVRKILHTDRSVSSKFQQILKQINKKQNNSAALKFYILAKKAGLLQILKERFEVEANLKIKDLSEKKGWSNERQILAVAWKKKIEKVLRQKNPKKRMDIIWQGHRHETKYSQSEEEIQSFQRKMKKINKSKLRKGSR